MSFLLAGVPVRSPNLGSEEFERIIVPEIRELADDLQDLEPGGTLVDDVVLMQNKQKVRIAYTAHPVMLTIQEKGRVFILRVV